MTENVAATIDAGAFAVPDAGDAIELRARRQIELLRAPDRRRSEVFVHTRLEFDVVLFEVLARGMKLLVVAAEGRSTIAGDKAGGVQPHRPIPPHLRHRQPDQSLDAGFRPGMGNVVPDRFFWALPPPEEGADGEVPPEGGGPAEPEDHGSKGPSRRIH